MSSVKQDDTTLATFADHASLSFQEHWVYQLDGQGGRVAHRAQYRFLPPHEGKAVIPWGLAQMDNGEIVVAGVAGAIDATADQCQTVVAFSRDAGATWGEYHPVEGCSSRPMMLAYLGNGVLSFMLCWEKEIMGEDNDNVRLYSHDYGRTWPEQVKLPTAPDGYPVNCEGSSLIERDENGVAILMGETGATMSKGPGAKNPQCGCIRWSCDGGRTWENFSWPQEWKWQETYEGKSYERGVCEGSLIRAANGWLIAALRTDIPAQFIALEYDNFMGTAISISKDDGKTWSPPDSIFAPGRHHVNLVRLSNNDLVMTVVRRLDLQKHGELASYRRGCDAIVSHDNGLTWDIDHMYILDEFSAISGAEKWHEVVCGHLFSISLDNGMILTTYGNYKNAGALILWKPS